VRERERGGGGGREIVLVQKNYCRGKCVESHFYRKLFISVSNI